MSAYGVAAGLGRVVQSGLVLYLDAGNSKSIVSGSTTWTDISRNNNSGSLINGPAFSSANGGSIVFDGTNDYVTAGSTPSGTSLFTFSCWIFFNGDITGNWFDRKAAVLMSGNAGGTTEFVIMTSGSNAAPPFLISFGRHSGGTAGSCSFSPLNMPVNRYHNITLVRDGSASQKLYQNGELLVSGNVSTNFDAGTLHIGGAPAGGGFTGHLNGSIANVMRYNRALSATEVLQNYNMEKKRFGLS
jgi:hypothetical protein